MEESSKVLIFPVVVMRCGEVHYVYLEFLLRILFLHVNYVERMYIGFWRIWILELCALVVFQGTVFQRDEVQQGRVLGEPQRRAAGTQ